MKMIMACLLSSMVVLCSYFHVQINLNSSTMSISKRHYTISSNFEPVAKTSRGSEIEKRIGRDTARVPHGRHSRSRMAAELTLMRIVGGLIVTCNKVMRTLAHYFRCRHND